jgi:small subunit ribosomal protein S16
MVRIRMKRTGRRHTPSYRVTAVDARATRDGRVIEELGYYNPGSKNEAQRFVVNTDRIAYWLSQGAQPSDTVRTLLKAMDKAKAAVK